MQGRAAVGGGGGAPPAERTLMRLPLLWFTMLSPLRSTPAGEPTQTQHAGSDERPN
jgi:hypothetical protein